ncbi:CRISPR-associated endonuclease Cas2 [Oceanicella actignis]|uniref:CRISPR-associated endoribonuclease Cas2 n=1 Tax=Oceanicella actignis TaxID=1189325 RepID=A0A1M7S238_9RHOB|nr:CRISPR-associated endonuclease Cas2 [Oceanicella actignis]SES91218.1 CRISPR-associated protein Cas2 [Oceanicella actignis]SHN52454.1 CRISPR-associated protein Cas2 [Oceanicella actignis]
MPRQLLLVAYDISHPRRLASARDAVSAWAAGGQKSVFECHAAPAERAELARQMQRALAFEQDRLALFLTRAETARAMGIGEVARDEPLVWVG